MSFPRYPAYKPSGVEWLGEVPEHWDVLPCRGIIDERNEKNEGAACQDYLSLMANIGIIPYEEKGDVGNKKPEDLGKCKLVRKGDFVINSMNYGIGSYGVSGYDGVCSPVYIVLIPKEEEVKPGFAFRIFEDKTFQSHAQSFGNGILAHRCAIGWDILKGIGVPVPSSHEQERILQFLDHETAKIDALIAEQQRLIELLQEKRQAVISHAVTKGLNPDAPMKDSGVEWLGEVPEHWRNFRLKALFALKHGYAFDGSQFSEEGEYALMTPGNFIETGGFRRKDPEKYYVGSDMPSDFILQGGEMLIAMTEQAPGLVGTALIAPEGEHYLHNQRLGLVTRLKAEELDTSFLYWLMNSPVLKAKVGVTAAGQKVRHTSPQKILDNEICLPPLEEQRIIAQALFEANERCIKLTENACTSIQLLVERRSALISAAVTGQIDVRGLAPEASAS
jgi:type I restriction enzyme S subunit